MSANDNTILFRIIVICTSGIICTIVPNFGIIQSGVKPTLQIVSFPFSFMWQNTQHALCHMCVKQTFKVKDIFGRLARLTNTIIYQCK